MCQAVPCMRFIHFTRHCLRTTRSAVSNLHFRDSHISASRLPSKRSLVTAVPFGIHLRHMLLLYTYFANICFLLNLFFPRSRLHRHWPWPRHQSDPEIWRWWVANGGTLKDLQVEVSCDGSQGYWVLGVERVPKRRERIF